MELIKKGQTVEMFHLPADPLGHLHQESLFDLHLPFVPAFLFDLYGQALHLGPMQSNKTRNYFILGNVYLKEPVQI